jgi:hypothetical protein
VECRGSPLRPIRSASLEREEIRFYLAKLKDPSCIQRVPHDDFSDVFYTAAERLSEGGEAAIPGLIEKLDSRDPYELSVALFALMLAFQSVTAKTDGNYVGVVLSPEYNAENRAIALAWWKQYGARIGRKPEP